MPIGYAYVDENDVIYIRTVSPTILAAQVNAIVILSDGAIIPRADQMPSTIAEMFYSVTNGKGSIKMVEITVATP